MSVELDALPADVLISRLVEEIEKRMDIVELEQVSAKQELERERLIGALTAVEG